MKINFLTILPLAVTAFAAPGIAADYQTSLDPMPLNNQMQLVIQGRGNATASSDGKTMMVKGSFHSMPSNATESHIFLSPMAGEGGKSVFDLNVTKSTSGTISGQFKLTGAQATALRTGKLYIQINSEKAPDYPPWGPKGTLWGWLFPAHATAGQDVPQQGHWFLPQLDTPSR
jgi:hypothetical protein